MGRDKYCACIERKLPPKESRRLAGPVDVERLASKKGPNVEKQVNKLQKKLLKLGLGHYAVDLLISRLVDGQTLKDIVKEQGWTSIGAANHHLQQAIKTVRKGKL